GFPFLVVMRPLLEEPQLVIDGYGNPGRRPTGSDPSVTDKTYRRARDLSRGVAQALRLTDWEAKRHAGGTMFNSLHQRRWLRRHAVHCPSISWIRRRGSV